MRQLRPEDINTENRIRRLFDAKALQMLAESIKSKGLLHPPVVDSSNNLLAGERRVRACQLLINEGYAVFSNGMAFPQGTIPVLDCSELSPDARLEAELEENVLREDLTWQEEADAVAKLHKLRLSQQGSYQKASNPGGQTIQKTADEIAGGDSSGSLQGKTRDNLLLADHLDDPEVAAASTRKEALSVLKSKAEKTLSGMLAERVGARRSKDFVIINGSFEMWDEPMEFDCICTDPPYGVDAQAFGSQTASDRQHGYADDQKTWETLLEKFAYRSFFAAKKQAHAYVFVSFKNYERLAGFMRAAGWSVWHRPLIWDKGNQGLLPDPDHGPRFVHDYILYGLKGNRPVTRIDGDVLRVPQMVRLRRAAEKPLALYKELLSRTCNPGDRVWDPFCGTGPIFPAARELGLLAVGHDIDLDAINIAREQAYATDID